MHDVLGIAVYFDHATRGYWVVDADDLVELAWAVRGDVPDAHGRWCQATRRMRLHIEEIAEACDVDVDIRSLMDDAGENGDRDAWLALYAARALRNNARPG